MVSDQTDTIMMRNNKITITPPNAILSGHELGVIARNSKYKPTAILIKSSLDILKEAYPTCVINSELYDAVEFIAPGQNFESVSCNHCKQEMSIDFWQEKMSGSFESSHFAGMNFKTSCCDKMTNLNELIYCGDCGFASYSITINNAEPDESKELALTKMLSDEWGTSVKLFWIHI